jgi:sugar-specific transcriptional regulator TrmB
MLNQNTDKLKTLGFTEYEAKIFQSLANASEMSASEISESSRVPRPKVYDVLKGMVRSGLVKEIYGRVKKFALNDPEISFNSLKEKFLEETENKKLLFENLGEHYKHLFENNIKNISEQNSIQVIKQKDVINKTVGDIFETAKEELLFFNCPPYYRSTKEYVKQIQKLSAKSIRSLYLENEIADEDFKKAIQKYINPNEKIKIVSNLPIKMAIVDRHVILLTLFENSNSNTDFLTMIVKNAALAQTFMFIFEHFWQLGKDLK